MLEGCLSPARRASQPAEVSQRVTKSSSRKCVSRSRRAGWACARAESGARRPKRTCFRFFFRAGRLPGRLCSGEEHEAVARVLRLQGTLGLLLSNSGGEGVCALQSHVFAVGTEAQREVGVEGPQVRVDQAGAGVEGRQPPRWCPNAGESGSSRLRGNNGVLAGLGGRGWLIAWLRTLRLEKRFGGWSGPRRRDVRGSVTSKRRRSKTHIRGTSGHTAMKRKLLKQFC